MHPITPREHICKVQRVILRNQRVGYLANATIRKDLIAFEELRVLTVTPAETKRDFKKVFFWRSFSDHLPQ